MNIVRGTRLTSLSILVALALGVGGCMLSPYDGRRVSTRDSYIDFSGFYPSPNVQVALYANKPGTPTHVRIDDWEIYTATSGRPIDGVDWYPWSRSYQVPRAQWQAGVRGFHTLVSSRIRGSSLTSVELDYVSCWNRVHHSVGEFMGECASDHSPWAEVQTSDYVPFASTFDLEIAGCTVTPSSMIVTVRNVGARGRLTHVHADDDYSSADRLVDVVLEPGERHSETLPVSARVPAYITCSAEGRNLEDDSPEANTDNNSYSNIIYY